MLFSKNKSSYLEGNKTSFIRDWCCHPPLWLRLMDRNSIQLLNPLIRFQVLVRCSSKLQASRRQVRASVFRLQPAGLARAVDLPAGRPPRGPQPHQDEALHRTQRQRKPAGRCSYLFSIFFDCWKLIPHFICQRHILPMQKPKFYESKQKGWSMLC